MTTTLEHRYAPRGACAAIWERRDSEVLLSGPAGTGKSRACLEKLHLAALKYPGMRGLIVRKTQVSLTNAALPTWRKYVIPEMLSTGDMEFYGGSAEQPPQYRYRNGSRIMLAGMDKATKVLSSEYDMIYVQQAEELTEEDWETLTTRLRWGRMPYQQIIADANPDAPTHWLKQRCNGGTTLLLESRHEDNPLLYDENRQVTSTGKEYMAKLDNLTGVRYQRLRRGLWVAAEGIIFEEYDPAVHLIEPFEIPDDWTRWWSVDFGYTNPFVCQFWAEDPDGRLYLYREIYRTKRTVDQHAKEILQSTNRLELAIKQNELARKQFYDRANQEPSWKSEYGPNFMKRRADKKRMEERAASRIEEDGIFEPRPRAVVCDHDAEGRATLEECIGFSTTAANKKVLDGIQAVQVRLRDRRLFIFKDALTSVDAELADAHKPTCTAEEIPGYVWSNSKTKEQPTKEDDHGCDAMRYMVAERDLGARPRVRFM